MMLIRRRAAMVLLRSVFNACFDTASDVAFASVGTRLYFFNSSFQNFVSTSSLSELGTSFQTFVSAS